MHHQFPIAFPTLDLCHSVAPKNYVLESPIDVVLVEADESDRAVAADSDGVALVGVDSLQTDRLKILLRPEAVATEHIQNKWLLLVLKAQLRSGFEARLDSIPESADRCLVFDGVVVFDAIAIEIANVVSVADQFVRFVVLIEN